MRCSRRSWLAGALVAAALAAIGGSAIAFFTGEGVGTASAGVSKLSAPTITTATPAVGGTVALAWSTVSAPGTGTVKYFVTRDGGDPAGTCAAPAVPTAATSCTDSGLAPGTYTYTVTAVWRSWSVTSTVKTAKVTIGPAAYFTLAAATATPAVAASNNLTITAKDENGSTVTTYTGLHTLTFSGATASPSGQSPTIVNSSNSAIAFGGNTSINFTLGVATVTSSRNGVMKIYRAGPASIVATEASSAVTTTTPLALTVTPGAASKYVIAGATTTPTAGARNDLTITAQDGYGNTATAYDGPKNLVFSGATASPGGNQPVVSDSAGTDVAFGAATAIEFDAGVATPAGTANGEMTLYRSSSTANSITASDGSVNTPTALKVTVAAAPADKLVLSAATTTPVAAASTNLTTTARDAYENTATGYAGAKNITFSGPPAGPAGTLSTVVNSAGTVVNFGTPTALNFSAGVAAVSSSKNGLMRLYMAGATGVSATDGTISTATPLALTVAVGSAARWALSSVTASAGAIGSPCLFTCAVTSLGNGGTITAKIGVTDSAGNLVSNVGSGRVAKVTANGGTIAGTPLTIEAAGPALSAATFTYTAPANGNFSNTITVATSSGTSYTSATATASR
ncbi:MAG TPA: hypothetical protein VFY48_01595 [Solirubrobacterales bacterium]|nr:hypothetical protein [Solirubrobacterales bacterium]